MSFNRVLPRPPALCHDPPPPPPPPSPSPSSLSFQRHQNNILDHNVIMNDNNQPPPPRLPLPDRTITTDLAATDPSPMNHSPFAYNQRSQNRIIHDPNQDQFHLSSINRANVAGNNISVDVSSPSVKQSATLDTSPSIAEDTPMVDRSSSSSPEKISAVKDSSNFCLCQPDPRIPRPRNGTISFFLFFLSPCVSMVS